MASALSLAQQTGSAARTRAGQDFCNSDRSLMALLGLYLPAGEFAHLEPHLARLGCLVGDLDDLAREADGTHPGSRRATVTASEFALAVLSHPPALGCQQRDARKVMGDAHGAARRQRLHRGVD